MLLDLNQSDQQLWSRPKPNEGARLPATTEEGFAAAWNEGHLFGQSSAQANAQLRALTDYVSETRQKTGLDLTDAASHITINSDWSWMDKAVAKANEENPDLKLTPFTPDEMNKRAAVLSRQARQTYQEQQAGEGGGFGRFLGGLASAATDPFNVALAPFGGGEAGVLVTALKFGGLAAASQVANEAVQEGFRERVQPGYGASGEPGMNILEAGVSGAVLGGGLKALGNAWTRVKTGAWPTSVRDAGNVVENEANIQQSNVYPGASGDAAHREALAGAIDSIAKGEPVSVEHIITPEIEASARGIMTRLEGEGAMALPIFDERAIRLLSEESGLRARSGELDQHISGLPQGDLSAADRLNRLAVVEKQLETAEGPARRVLLERRDQILVDATPEALRAGAAPIAARQAAETERAAIQGRLSDIATERAQLETKAQPVSIGQREPVRLPFEQIRAATKALTEAAAAEKAVPAGPAPQLPFEATAAQAKADTATAALRSAVAQVAEEGGHTLSPDEIATIAARIAKMSPEDFADASRQIRLAPHQLAAEPARAPRIAEPEPLTARSPEEAAQMLASPDHAAALRSDIDRARQTGDVKIPAGVDERGEPVFRSLDAALDEVDGFKKAADEIQACAAPVQQEAAE